MTRTRTSTDTGPLTSIDYKQEVINYSGYCGTNVTSETRLNTLFSGSGNTSWSINRTMTDVVTPNFHKISKTGGIVNSPMSQNIVTVIEPVCRADIGYENLLYCSGIGKRLASKTRYYGPCNFTIATKPLSLKYSTMTPLTSSEIAASIDRASASAYASIDHTDVLAFACVAEAEKTVKGIATLLMKVYKVYKRLRRWQYKALLRDAKRVGVYADLYMQARYELRPLYYDAIGLIDAFKHVSPVVGSRETFRGFDRISKSLVNDYKFDHTYGTAFNLKCPCILRSSVVHEVTCRAGVLTQFMGSPLGNAFGVQAIPETIWELIPFSFIIDWFTNVGTVVAAWSPNVESKYLASWMVVESTTTKTAKVIPSTPVYASASATSPEAVNAYCDIDANHQQITVTKTRIPFAKRFTFPHFTVNLDPLKILDLGIILSNIFKLGELIKKGYS